MKYFTKLAMAVRTHARHWGENLGSTRKLKAILNASPVAKKGVLKKTVDVQNRSELFSKSLGKIDGSEHVSISKVPEIAAVLNKKDIRGEEFRALTNIGNFKNQDDAFDAMQYYTSAIYNDKKTGMKYLMNLNKEKDVVMKTTKVPQTRGIHLVSPEAENFSKFTNKRMRKLTGEIEYDPIDLTDAINAAFKRGGIKF